MNPNNHLKTPTHTDHKRLHKTPPGILQHQQELEKKQHVQDRQLRHKQRNSHDKVSHHRLQQQQQPSSLDFAEAKTLLNNLLDLIYNRYQLYDEDVNGFFYAAQTFSEHSWDIWKYRFAKKIVHADNDSSGIDSSYVMIFGGSSVTAGHDNRRNSSYPGIVEKRLHSIFAALGVDLRVHNIAQGANGCYPYELLYETMGEEDPDFVGWEQSYNCGHDAPSFLATSRVAALSKRRGSVYFGSSGGWLPHDHDPSPFSPPYCSEDWTVESVQSPQHTPLLQHWSPTADDLLQQRHKLSQYDTAQQSYDRYFPGAYKSALAPSGFNVWIKNPLATAKYNASPSGAGSGGGEKVKRGVSAAEAGVEKDTAIRFFSKEAARFDNPSGNGARHHPSQAFHMWRGESIVWLHALTLLDALFMVEKDLKAGRTRQQLYEAYSTAMETLQGPLPPPPAVGTSCNIAGRHCELKAMAFTDYSYLHQLKRTLTSIVVGKSDWIEDMALYPGETPGPDFATSRYQLERKPSYHNEGRDGEIYVKILTGSTPFVLLCGAKQESLKHTVLTLDLHAAEDDSKDYTQYSFSNRLRDKNKDGSALSPLVEWKDRHYVGSECTELSRVPPGKHILGISRNDSSVLPLIRGESGQIKEAHHQQQHHHRQQQQRHINSLIHVVVW